MKDSRHTEHMSLASVLVVEDDQFSRTLIASALSSRNLAVVGATAKAAQALALARTTPVDVALLDLDLGPGPTGFELAIVLRREFSRIGIVFLTSYLDPRLVGVEQSLIPPGARFLRKSDVSDAGAVITAILQAKSRPLVVQRYQFGEGPRLTDNQIIVLRRVAEGRSTREIAEELGVTDKAIEASIARVHRIVESAPSGSASTRVALVRAFYAITGRSAPRA